jgi:hypothetical protein
MNPSAIRAQPSAMSSRHAAAQVSPMIRVVRSYRRFDCASSVA